MFIQELFANAVEFAILLGFVELIVAVFLLVVLIRFLWTVPDALRDIAHVLRKFYYRNDGDDFSHVDSVTVSRIQQSVEDDFNNSSTLR